MKKYIAVIFATVMALGLAACGAKDSPAENTEAESVSAVNSESAAETGEKAPISYVGRWYMIRTDMTMDGTTLEMSLKDMAEDIDENAFVMEINNDRAVLIDLHDENAFVMEINEDGTVIMKVDEEIADAKWSVIDNGISVIGEMSELGVDTIDFIAEDPDLLRGVMVEDGMEMGMYYAREGSPRIEESKNTSYLEKSLGKIMGEMMEENMPNLTLDSPLTLNIENSEDVSYCGFEAPDTGEYTFRSESGGHDTVMAFDSTSFAEPLIESGNAEGGFEITMSIEKGKIIFLEVTSDQTAVTVTVEKK